MLGVLGEKCQPGIKILIRRDSLGIQHGGKGGSQFLKTQLHTDKIQCVFIRIIVIQQTLGDLSGCTYGVYRCAQIALLGKFRESVFQNMRPAFWLRSSCFMDLFPLLRVVYQMDAESLS